MKPYIMWAVCLVIILVDGWVIGDAVRSFKRHKYTAFGIDIMFTIFGILAMASWIFNSNWW